MVVAIAGWLLVKLTTRFRGGVGVSWRYGIANLGRRRTESVVQLTAFALGIMMLLLLAVVRNDLLNDWRRSLPADTPNFFFINIPPDEHQAFAHVPRRARRAARAGAADGPCAHDAHQRQVRSTTSSSRRARQANSPTAIRTSPGRKSLGATTMITAGHWFTAEEFGKPLVSVSTEYMEELNLKLGDELQFDIAGETRTATISSVREVKWDSFQPNFFLMFAPGLLEGSQGTWMTAAHLPTHQPEDHRRPGAPLPERVGVQRGRPAAPGALGHRQGRGRRAERLPVHADGRASWCWSRRCRPAAKNAAMKAPCCARSARSRSTVLKGLLAEFAALGVLSGALAAAGASIAGAFIATRVLQIPYYAGSVGVDLRPGGRRIAGLLRGLAGHALRGEPAAGADLAG